MGNALNKQDSTTPKKSLSQIIDYVAANYIVTQNFKDMKNLSNMEYCNKLVILTSKIINNSLSNLEVDYLAQRLKGTEEVNYMNKDRVMFLDKDNLQSLDVRNQTQKRRLCIGIAKHYVKIAHLFAAISTTINPVYTYTNETGERVSSSLAEKDSIPAAANVKVKLINICNKRIDALVNETGASAAGASASTADTIRIKPNFCQMNYDESSGQTKTFFDEPGIPELEKLYYDKYDYDRGDFIGMTDKMRTDVYEKDVEKFYKIFTGIDSMPDTIKTFSQIPLKDFHKSVGCKSDGVYNKSAGYEGSLKDKLFKQYAEHIQAMMNTTTTNQNKLLAIIDKLFVFNINIQTNKKEIVVNSKLTEKTLQEIVEETRKLIIELYIGCEQDFLSGLEIFEAIVEKQIIDTSKEQIKLLQSNIDNELTSSDISETIKPTDEVLAPVPVAEPPVSEPPVTDSEPLVTEPAVTEPPTFETEVENEIIKEDALKPAVYEQEQVPMPAPMPAPMPVTMPAPMPVTMPAPMPATMPAPMPVPMPAPMPATMPVPMPVPMPAPTTPGVAGGTRKKRYNKFFKKSRKNRK